MYVIWLAAKRLRAKKGSAALAAAGIAAGAAALAVVLAGSMVAQDRSVARALRAIDPTQQPLRATWGGISGQGAESFASLDRAARRALTPLTGRPPFAVLLYKESRFGGALADLGAIDGLGRWVRLRSGRLPRVCTPSRCEVVQVAGAGPLPQLPGAHFVRVGTGRLVSGLPLGESLGVRAPTPAEQAAISYHAPHQPPVLLAEGVPQLLKAAPLDLIYRTISWVVPLRSADVHPWSLDAFAARVARAGSELENDSDAFGLTSPVSDLQTARDQARVAGRRLLLVGGTTAALLLAFALLAASAMSQEAEAAARRLTWYGARRRQLAGIFAAEAAATAVVGAAVGWAAGSAVSIAVADRAGSPAWAVVTHSALAASGLAAAAGVGVAAALILLGSLRPSRLRVGALRLSPVDLAAVAALAVVVLTLARGQVSASALAQEQGTGVTLLILPGLAAFVAAVACVRLLGPGLRLLERAARRASVPVRLAALSVARHPGRSAIAVGFLVVSLGLALFASTYRSTLTRNQADEAAFAVPLDYTLQEDFSNVLEPPLAAAPLSAYRALGPGVQALPVIREFGDAGAVSGAVSTAVLGIPSGGLRLLRWRSDFSATSPATLARRIEPNGPVALRGLRLPADARTLTLPVELRGKPIKLTATVETLRQDFVLLPFGLVLPGRHRLASSLPPAARGGLVTSLELDLSIRGNRIFGQIGGRGNIAEEAGALTLGRMTAGGMVLPGYSGWIGNAGIRPLETSGGAQIRYLLTSAVLSHFRPRQPTDGRPVPVIASPALARAAGPDGIVPIQLGDQRLHVRVVGIASRFPTIDSDFVVGDESWLLGAMNADFPGAGVPSEIWIKGGPQLGRTFEQPPFDVLQLSSRRAVLEGLRSDPLARGSLIALGFAAVIALLLALAGVMLAVAGDLRDERGELRDLEAQGAEPATLRRHLRLRALLLVGIGLAGGIATGAALGGLVVGVVTLTANASSPEPPLRLEVDWPLLAAGLAAYAVLVVALVAALTWNAFRGEAVRLQEATA